VVALNDASFDSVVTGDKNVLVEFYAVCATCRSFCPFSADFYSPGVDTARPSPPSTRLLRATSPMSQSS
jgi:hypothetical protein